MDLLKVTQLERVYADQIQPRDYLPLKFVLIPVLPNNACLSLEWAQEMQFGKCPR